MLSKKKSSKRNLLWCTKSINIWDVNVDNKVKTKTNSKHLIGSLKKVIRPLVLVLTKQVIMLRHLKLKMEIKIRTIN